MDLHRFCFQLGTYFPEVHTWDSEKQKLCIKDLLGREEEADISTILHDIRQVDVLRELPLVPQRSKEWFELRMNRLTASDLAQAMGRGKFGNRKTLLAKKAFPDSTPMRMLPALKWGTMFEDMGVRCYQQLVNPVKIYDFGLIPHPEINCFGASPDGITETGIMVEMKCPFIRKCDYQVPEQYYLQIQGQLSTCKLQVCDYVECYYDTYHDITEYTLMCEEKGNKEHGIILEFTYKGSDNWTYVYSPENMTVKECIEWANREVDTVGEELLFMKMTPWKLKQLFHTRVKFDKELWDSVVPSIYEFWKDVENARARGPLEPIVTTATNPSSRTTKSTLNMVDPVPAKKYRFIEDSDEEG